MSSPSASTVDSATLAEVAELEVFDRTGQKVRFGSIYKNQKVVIVFVRHFGCGRCQDYTAQLASVRQEALSEAGTKIVVIGCGESTVIDIYRGYTGFEGQIYANPSRSLYNALGMVSNMKHAADGEIKKSYAAQSSMPFIVVRSLARGFSHPTQLTKHGSISQQGGEFIFGPGNNCSYTSRMEHGEDHAEVAELMQAAEVTYP